MLASLLNDAEKTYIVDSQINADIRVQGNIGA